MSTSKNIYCTAPWNGLTVREDGSVKVCCSGGVNVGNLNRQSINEVLNGVAFKNIQNNMINGIPDIENCAGCIKQEQKTGLASLRQHYLKFYPDIQDSLQLRTLDIRWNNTCNLGCLYCNPTFSSTWCDRKNIINLSPVKKYQDDLLDFILDRADSLREIMLVGGEPMLMKQNYRLLQRLPTTTKVSIITNLSYDLKNLPCWENLINRPKENLLWNISCENVGKQFEYVRSGAQWNTLVDNINLINQYWPDSVTINMVYSMFSAFDIDQTVKTFHQLGIKKYSLQTCFGNPEIDVFRMPAPIRKKAHEILTLALNHHKENIEKNVHPDDQNFYNIQHIDFIFHQLAQENNLNHIRRSQFMSQIDSYNQWGDTKFSDLWPHVVNLVNQYLD